MEKKLTRKEQAQITKKNIYDSAIALIESKGYENVSIEDITTKANTAKGTFYLYFKSKQDLIYHTIHEYDEIARKTYEEIKHLDTFEEQLTAYLKLSNSRIDELGEKILNALLGHNLTAETKFVTVKQREIYESLRKIIEKGFETGELSAENGLDFYMESIIVMVQGLDYYWCNAPEGFDYVSASEREAKIFVKGLIALYGGR